MARFLTVPQIADRLGFAVWQVRRLYEAGILPDPPRAGLTRLIPESDIPRIINALRERGYLPLEVAVDA